MPLMVIITPVHLPLLVRLIHYSKGRKIAQPMKYISNAFLAVYHCFVVKLFSGTFLLPCEETIENRSLGKVFTQCNIANPNVRFNPAIPCLTVRLPAAAAGGSSGGGGGQQQWWRAAVEAVAAATASNPKDLPFAVSYRYFHNL